ncbi:hypothetical protein [Bradyrhizobium japonicum]|nr:hypothetical protein [Bradyrhizobium japonicum]
MTDLIWVGNTLCPRWVAFATIGLVALTLSGVMAAISGRISK